MNKYKNIYVICPANSVTGGPDALHQMVYYLNEMHLNAKIVYVSNAADKKDFKIAEPYRKYLDAFLLEKDIQDDECSAIIIPEMYSKKIRLFYKAKIFIW